MQQAEIRVKGKLDARWAAWLDGLAIRHLEPDVTVLTGSVVDQAALYGLIAKLRDLGLSLTSVKCFEEANESATG